MRPHAIFILLSTALLIAGLIVIPAYYALIPGYAPVYLAMLGIAAIVGFLGYRRVHDPEIGGPANSILGACVIYWALRGADPPDWMTQAFLISTPLTVAAALFTLWRRVGRQRANGG